MGYFIALGVAAAFAGIGEQISHRARGTDDFGAGALVWLCRGIAGLIALGTSIVFAISGT